MMDATLLTALFGGGGFLAGLFALIKYLINENRKQQTELLKYMETKNGHIERISNRFAASADTMSEAVAALTTEIAIMNKNGRI